MKTIIKTLLFCSIAVSLVGCASIVSRSQWPLTVNSNPSGANLEITDRNGMIVFQGTTPAMLKLKSGAGFFVPQTYTVKISLDGYEQKIVTVGCNVNGWYIGNIIFGGLIGLLIVDPATGAMYRLSTEVINADLTPITTSERSIQIININDLPQEYRNHLIAIQ